MTESCYTCRENTKCFDLKIVMRQTTSPIGTVMRQVDDIHRLCVRKYLQEIRNDNTGSDSNKAFA